MASASAGDLGRHLCRLFGAGSAVGLTDGELVRRFADRRDESAEAAFETILSRHGALVMTVCRQVLGDVHAAEDAFQATFLVLVRRARSLRVREPGSLGPWLHGVAYRTALKARQGAARRRKREHRVATTAVEQSSAAIEQGELQSLLHEEVDRLPAKYRAPVVLCYFEGRTHDEAAAALHWPVGTVRGRLARARDLLRARLVRRGLAPAGLIGPGGSLLAPEARAEIPAGLRDATVATAMARAPAAAGVAALANFMLRSLLLARVRTTAIVLSAVLMTAGVSLALRGAFVAQPPGRPDPAPASAAAGPTRPGLVDRYGDPLPKYARARMGTNRFHAGSHVNQVLYTPDAKFLVTVDHIPVVSVWDATTGRIVREIGDSPADAPTITPSRKIALAPDGKTLATVDYPSRLRLWDLATGRERRRWHEVRGEEYEHLSFSPDGRTVAVSVQRFDEATRKSETFIDLWDPAAPTERRRRIPGGWARLWDLKFSPDGKILATASRDTEIMRGNTLIGPDTGSTRLWDLATGREQRRFPVQRVDAHSLAFSRDGKRLACVVDDGPIRLYDLTTGRERELRPGARPALEPAPPKDGLPTSRSRPRAASPLRWPAFSPDGSILAAFEDRESPDAFPLAAVHLWDVARGRELHPTRAHQQWVSSRAFASDGKSLAFAPDGKTLAWAGAEPVIRLWDVGTGRAAFPQSGHRSAIRSLIVSPTEGTVFTGGSDGTIRHWDPASGRELGLIAQLSGPVEALAIALDGKTLLVRGPLQTQPQQAGGIRLWSVAEHREIRRLARIRDRNAVPYVAYSPDGKTVASEGRIWDAVSGEVLVTLRHHDPQNDEFLSFCPIFYTPDGKQLITAEPDGARLWDITTGRELRQATRWSNDHDRATLSPDGRFLATRGPGGRSRGQSDDPPIILWELASGQEVATLEAQGEAVLRRPFSPDGRFLASASRHRGAPPNSTVRVLDLATGRELRRFEGHRGAVNALAFSPDGRWIVSGSEDATALVWDVSDLKDQQKSEPLTAESLEARWEELAGNDARTAYHASWALSVPSAVSFLRDHLRPAAVAKPITAPEVLRTVRALAALERASTPEARGVIERLANGDPSARETREARAALDRLKPPSK